MIRIKYFSCVGRQNLRFLFTCEKSKPEFVDEQWHGETGGYASDADNDDVHVHRPVDVIITQAVFYFRFDFIHGYDFAHGGLVLRVRVQHFVPVEPIHQLREPQYQHVVTVRL